VNLAQKSWKKEGPGVSARERLRPCIQTAQQNMGKSLLMCQRQQVLSTIFLSLPEEKRFLL
jgi:hypothetical protein